VAVSLEQNPNIFQKILCELCFACRQTKQLPKPAKIFHYLWRAGNKFFLLKGIKFLLSLAKNLLSQIFLFGICPPLAR